MQFRFTVLGDKAIDWEVSAPRAASDSDVLGELGYEPSQYVIKSAASRRENVDGPYLCEGALVELVNKESTRQYRRKLLSGPSSCLTLITESGSEAGRVVKFPSGSTLIGRGDRADIKIADEELSRIHFKITTAGAEARVEDQGSTNGTFINQEQISVEVILKDGDLLAAGNSSWRVVVNPVSPVAMNYLLNRTFQFNRPFRIEPPLERVEIEWPAQPLSQRKSPFPWLTAIAPAVVGAIMAAVLKNPMYLFMAGMSPVVFLLNQAVSRRQSNRSTREDETSFRQRLTAAEEQLSSAVEQERRQALVNFPNTVDTAPIAQAPTLRLWERRSEQSDFLLMRIGIGSRQANVNIKSPNLNLGNMPTAPILSDIPIVISVREFGVVGIAGSQVDVTTTSRWFALQAITFQAPDDLLISVLSDQRDADWSWLRWAPHTRFSDEFSLVATNSEHVDRVLRNLREVVDQRASDLKDHRNADTSSPTILVFMDGAAKLRMRPEVAALLDQGPAVGVFFICIDIGLELLPEECNAVVDLSSGASTAVIKLSGHPTQTNIVCDIVRLDEAELSARSIAPLQRVDAAASVGRIPKSVRFLDQIGLSEPTAEKIASSWASHAISTNVLIGVGENGPQYLDIVKDGPHGLVAGTTGAGKSEFLQTLVAALAIANRPENLQFVFVDYKGGAAFAPFKEIPHTAGVVTNLNSLLTKRALSSINAEMKRRQRLLDRFKAADFNRYEALRQKDQTIPAIPRLLIVIDEFKELKENLPEFIDGLDGVVRLGRSLGMHLVLATQRTSGAVTPEIKANSNWRVSLRVASDAESLDLLDTVDAARLSNNLPGRAYLKVGADRPPIQFQSGYVGGLSTNRYLEDAIRLNPANWDELKTNQKNSGSSLASTLTDLDMISQALSDASKIADLADIPKIWTDPLPLLYSVNLDAHYGDDWSVEVGRHDQPLQQRISNWPMILDENYLILGRGRSGRTTLLRTFAAAAASKFSADSVHMYALDGGNALEALTKLPHVGAVVSRGQTERMRRLLKKLENLIDKRSEELGASGFSNIREQWRATSEDEHLSREVLLIDRWESLVDTLEDQGMDSTILKLLSQGPSVGLSVVVTGDESLLRTRIPNRVSQSLILRLNDASVGQRAGLSTESSIAATELVPGRALLLQDGSEVQIGVLVDGEGPSENNAIGEIASRCAKPSPNSKPLKVALLNAKQSLTALLDGASNNELVLGVGGDEGETLTVSLSQGFLSTSQSRKGRSSTLLALCRSAIHQGHGITVVAPKASPLLELEDRVNLLTGAEIATNGWTSSIPVSDLLFIDDYDSLSTDVELKAYLSQRGVQGLFIALDLDSCTIPNAHLRAIIKQMHQVLLICPPDHLTSQSVGIQIERGAGFSSPPGRGLFQDRNGQVLAQVGFDS